MVENLNEQKSSDVVNKKPQKMKNRKKLLLRLIAVICAVGLAVGVFFLYQIWKDNQPLKIGDVEISKEKIATNSSDMDKYLKNNDGITFGEGPIEEIARKDLILNALLKSESKKCDSSKYKPVTSIDIYAGLNYSDNPSEEEAKQKVDAFIKENGEFNRVRLENEAYKKKYEDCILAHKEIFRVSTLYDNPSTLSKSDTDFKKEVEDMKKNLEDNYLPLFKSGLSKEEIAERTNYNTLNATPDTIKVKGNPKYIVSAFVDKWGNSVESGSSLYHNNAEKSDKEKLLNSDNINNVVSKLERGKYTDVLISDNGEVGIYRIESSSDGYVNWDDFYNKLTANKLSMRVGSYVYAATIWTASGLRSVDKLWYSQCHDSTYVSIPKHNVSLKVSFKVEGSTGSVAGHTVQSRQGYAVFNGSPTCGINTDDTSGADGVAYAVINCLALTPELAGQQNAPQTGKSRISIAPANGYDFVRFNNFRGGTKGLSHSLWDTNVFWGANQTSESNIEAIVKKKEREKRQVRQSYPSNANTSVQANTKVAVKENGSSSPIAQNSSEWRTGTLVAPVGSHVSFKHEVTGNTSSNNNQGNVSVNWNTSGQNKPGLATNGSGNLSSRLNGLAVRQGNTTETKNNNWSSNSSFRVSNADVGKIICDNIRGTITQNPKTRVVTYQVYVDNGQEVPGTRIEYWEDEPAQSRTATSNQSCVYVPYEFELIPCIKAGNANCGGADVPVEPGTSTPVVPRITGTGTPTPPNSHWIITRWKIPGNFEGNPETPKERRDNNNSNTCSHYNNEFGGHVRECNSGQTGTGSFTGNPPTVINTGDIGVPNDAELGTRYCIGLSISPYKMERNESQAAQNAKAGRDWRHSAPICVLVTKKPKMQVWGNGVYSRGGIKTSRSEIGGNSLGSWVEFEAIGGKTITGFRTESSQNTSNLTFRNGIANSTGRNSSVTDRGNWGQWGSSNNVNHLIESLKARYPRSDNSRNVHVEGDLNSNANISGFTNTGTRIYYAKDANITGNIINSEPRSNGGNFAQTIIIANNINISKDVTRVDAWLIASNEINTCPVGKKNVNESNCGKQLTVNGPLIARNLNSWRTAGSTPTDRKAPSEIYNQRADVYLWAYGQSGGIGRIITTYTKELPVRY